MLWPLKGEGTLQKPKGVLQICIWKLLLKSFEMDVKELNFKNL